MAIPRTMVFLDAENLVFRYQAMLQEGWLPNNDVVHIPDVLVWHPSMTQVFGYANVGRVYLYTSMVGDDAALRTMKRRIADITYEYKYAIQDIGTAQIVPVVFKKQAKNHKSRQVDISITIDMMRFAHNPSIDLLVLASGDGDYLPLVQEVMRYGKEVYVGAFSSGLAADLCHSVDEFFNLNKLFFVEPVAKDVNKPAKSAKGKRR